MAVETRNFYPSLTRHVTPTKSGSDVVSYISDLKNGGPILTLIHGYPQSAFIWRHVIPLLLGKVSLYVPELPGYGISTPAKTHTKLAVGTALLDSLQKVFDAPPGQKLILGGHDRGARICHRLAVSRTDFPHFEVEGTVLLDIVPTKVQWDKFADPTIATGYFHWPLLANVELAVRMITALGGGNWARGSLRIAGNEKGLQRIQADEAVEVYAALFEKEETIRYSCEDYAAGAAPEYNEQVEDQKAGRKLDVPTVVMYSAARLGSRIDVAEEWKDFIAPGTSYEPVAVGEGYGHYLPEEAYDIVSEKILSILERYRG
ncbi:alpha/beta hydrolase [Thozetella sp. PMI_491]|nr:alpha/beta hydrolase [Thozetella sp. PMI_491]